MSLRSAAVATIAIAVVTACTGGDSDSADTAAVADTSSVVPTSAEPAVDSTTDAAPTSTPATEVTVTTVAASKDVVTRSPDAVGDGVPPTGFATATLRVTAADGSVCEVCVWLAADADRRATGLMGVTDLGEPVGMAFAYSAPSEGNFFMFSTPTPLSIAWFGPDGGHVGEVDMEPCLVEDSTECERYGASAPYTLAVEMFRTADGDRQLDRIGIGPGATAVLVETHPAASPCDGLR